MRGHYDAFRCYVRKSCHICYNGCSLCTCLNGCGGFTCCKKILKKQTVKENNHTCGKKEEKNERKRLTTTTNKVPFSTTFQVIPLPWVFQYSCDTILTIYIIWLKGSPVSERGVTPVRPLPGIFEESNPHIWWHVAHYFILRCWVYADQICRQTPAVVLSIPPRFGISN